MKPIRALVLLAVWIPLGCQRQPAEPQPAPTPDSTPAVVTEKSAPSEGGEISADAATVGVEDAEPLDVEAPATVNLDPQDLENRRVREEVLKRIDVTPNLSSADKDRLYVQVDRARALGKVITIPFASGKTTVGAAEATALGEKLQLGQVKQLTENPMVIFVVLGYADRKGDPQKNLAISLSRAESAMAVLRDRYKLMNIMHAVGMGSSEMFDAEDLDKNRVAEVWAVLP